MGKGQVLLITLLNQTDGRHLPPSLPIRLKREPRQLGGPWAPKGVKTALQGDNIIITTNDIKKCTITLDVILPEPETEVLR